MHLHNKSFTESQLTDSWSPFNRNVIVQIPTKEVVWPEQESYSEWWLCAIMYRTLLSSGKEEKNEIHQIIWVKLNWGVILLIPPYCFNSHSLHGHFSSSPFLVNRPNIIILHCGLCCVWGVTRYPPSGSSFVVFFYSPNYQMVLLLRSFSRYGWWWLPLLDIDVNDWHWGTSFGSHTIVVLGPKWIGSGFTRAI